MEQIVELVRTQKKHNFSGKSDVIWDIARSDVHQDGFVIRNGYAWINQIQSTKLYNPDEGSPLPLKGFFGNHKARDLIIDVHGDSKKLKLQFEGKVGSVNVQYVASMPDVRIQKGIFSNVKEQQRIEVNNNCEWNIGSLSPNCTSP